MLKRSYFLRGASFFFMILSLSLLLGAKNTETKYRLSALQNDLALIITETKNIDSLNRIRDTIEEQGGKIALLFPPHVMIGWIPRGILTSLVNTQGIEKISYQAVQLGDIQYKDPQVLAAVSFFNDFSSGKIETQKESALAIEGKPLINDAIVPPPLEYDKYLDNLPPGTAPSPGNSDAMTGTAAVCLFFIESNGAIDTNAYTWNSTDFTNTYNRALSGLIWWANKASLDGQALSFSLSCYPPSDSIAQQGYEPILHPSYEDYLWINAIMSNLGFSSGNSLSRVTAHNTWLRSYYGTDWSYSVFIGYNPSSASSTFTDGYFAYAYIGGPYTQLLFNNNGWGEGNFDLVLSHETGHIFYACDEYYQPGYGGCTSCGSCASYGPRPYVPNSNCAYCNPSPVNCMMRNNADVLCRYTKYQIGWLPAPSEFSDVNSFTISPGQTRSLIFTVTNSKTYTEAGYLSLSVSSGLEIIEVNGLTVDPFSYSSQTQNGIQYINYPVGSSLIRCDSGSISSGYQLVETSASYSTGESRDFAVKIRAKTGISSPQWIFHRSALYVPNNYYVRYPMSGNPDQQGCFSNEISVTVSQVSTGCVFYFDTNWDSFNDLPPKNFGKSGDIPVSGDWNGDGKTDYGVYRPGNSKFYLDSDWDGTADIVKTFGRSGDIPVTGDWDSDGTTNYGVFRPSNCKFYLDTSWDSYADIVNSYGGMGDIPVSGDWDGNGKSDYGIYRPSKCKFYLDTNGDSFADIVKAYGSPGDIPVTGDWTGTGSTHYGVYRSSQSKFFLDTNGDSFADITKAFGKPGDSPVTGDWNKDGRTNYGVFRK